jgi:hypothetical protein
MRFPTPAALPEHEVTATLAASATYGGQNGSEPTHGGCGWLARSRSRTVCCRRSRDLAALNKVEVLPQDERGRVDASYKGLTGAEYDQLLHTIADICCSDDVRSRRPVRVR